MNTSIQNRLDKLRKALAENSEFDAVLIMQPQNRRYYSGFSGSNGYLVIGEKEQFVITDGRYFEQAPKEAPLFELFKTSPDDGKSLVKTLARLLRDRMPVKKIGFEEGTVTIGLFRTMEKEIPDAAFNDAGTLIDSFRIIKEGYEVDEIKKAVAYAEKGFLAVQDKFAAGISERELAAEMGYHMRLAGADKESFDTIVASGPNGALPHAKASDKLLMEGEAVVVDWGAFTRTGYNSDMTRTLFVGEPDPFMADIYSLVLKAQLAVLDSLKVGMTCAEADAIARDIISGEGYGEYFSHGLGHGLGMAVHEQPTINRGIDVVLRPGMMITVEPGIYIPGKGGVRIEDLVHMTEEGPEILTSLPKPVLQ